MPTQIVTHRPLMIRKAWHFHAPDRALAAANNITYDSKYWGTSSNIHASFPTFVWPFLSKPHHRQCHPPLLTDHTSKRRRWLLFVKSPALSFREIPVLVDPEPSGILRRRTRDPFSGRLPAPATGMELPRRAGTTTR